MTASNCMYLRATYPPTYLPTLPTYLPTYLLTHSSSFERPESALSSHPSTYLPTYLPTQMGDPNASIPTPEPVMMRPMYGALGAAVGPTSIAFVSQAAVDSGSLKGR